jgi:hypothetical protein
MPEAHFRKEMLGLLRINHLFFPHHFGAVQVLDIMLFSQSVFDVIFSSLNLTFLSQDGNRNAGVFQQTGHFGGEVNYAGGYAIAT